MYLVVLRHVGSQFPNQGSNHVPCIAGQILSHWTPRKVPLCEFLDELSPSTSSPLSSSQWWSLGGPRLGSCPVWTQVHGRAPKSWPGRLREAVVGRGGLESAWPRQYPAPSWGSDLWPGREFGFTDSVEVVRKKFKLCRKRWRGDYYPVWVSECLFKGERIPPWEYRSSKMSFLKQTRQWGHTVMLLRLSVFSPSRDLVIFPS